MHWGAYCHKGKVQDHTRPNPIPSQIHGIWLSHFKICNYVQVCIHQSLPQGHSGRMTFLSLSYLFSFNNLVMGGGTAVWWLEPFPHSKKILDPPGAFACLSNACLHVLPMFEWTLVLGLQFPPSVALRMHVNHCLSFD